MAARPMKIAVFTKNLTNPAYAAARLGADRAAARFGVEARHFVPRQGDDPLEQSELVTQALAESPDAIVFSPVHPTRVNAAIGRIVAAGIPIVGFVNPIEAAPAVSYVGSDDYRLALDIAGYLCRRTDGRGDVLVVTGPADSFTSQRRLRGFEDAVRNAPGVRIIGIVAGDYQRIRAHEAAKAWLADNPQCDGCLVANDIMAIGVLDALRDAGRRCAVVGVNAIPEAIAAIRRGEMLATADFNAMQMAFLATECAVRHLRGEAVPASIELPVEIVDQTNCQLWEKPYESRALKTLEEMFP
jgi:ribose transport system substrate-binding protein